ncbi:MAG: hypothetical protein QXP53_02805 [Candidatus Pacearchaeota archaeon]
MEWVVIKDNFIQALLMIFEKSEKIVVEPSLNPQMLWMLIPLLTGLFIIEIYFGHYKREELGWNSAVSNSLVLFFVGMNLFSYLSTQGILRQFSFSQGISFLGSETSLIKIFIAGFVVFEAVLLFILNFTHALPKKFAFGISSGLYLNFLGCISIILVYGNISFDILLVPAILLIFLCLVVFLGLIEAIEPTSWHTSQE